MNDLVQFADRIQINGRVSPAYVNAVCGLYPNKIFITQYNSFMDELGISADNHQVLVDASGGLGRLPFLWERPDTTKRVGFAGGLNLTNVAREIPRILDVMQHDGWVDMESGVRSQDQFSEAISRTIYDRIEQAEREWRIKHTDKLRQALLGCVVEATRKQEKTDGKTDSCTEVDPEGPQTV